MSTKPKLITITPPVATQPTLVLAMGHANEPVASLVGDRFRIAAEVAILDELPSVLARENPDVVLVSRYLPGAHTLWEAMPQVRKAAPTARIVLVVGEDDQEARRIIQAGAQCGVFNVLVGPNIEPDALISALSEDRTWSHVAPYLPERFEVPAVEPKAPKSSPVLAPADDPPLIETRLAKIVAVVSGKGGVGKTTVAANLLAAGAHVGAVGIDYDYDKPDLASRFFPEERPGADLRDLLDALQLEEDDELSREDARRVADWVDHLPEAVTGLTILPGPKRHVSPVTVPTSLSDHLLDYACRRGKLVVADTAAGIADLATMHLLERADHILVVTQPLHASVYEAAWLVARLKAARLSMGKVRLVVNMAGRKGSMPPQEAADQIGLPLAFSVPDDPRTEASHMSRKPLALRDRGGVFARYIAQILNGEAPVRTPRRRGFLFAARKGEAR